MGAALTGGAWGRWGRVDYDVQMGCGAAGGDRERAESIADLAGNFYGESHLFGREFDGRMCRDCRSRVSECWLRWLDAGFASLNVAARIALCPGAIGVEGEEANWHAGAGKWGVGAQHGTALTGRCYGTVLMWSTYGFS